MLAKIEHFTNVRFRQRQDPSVRGASVFFKLANFQRLIQETTQFVFRLQVHTQMEMEEKDQIVKSIGNIGKWQWCIILPLALREVFTSWQMLSPPFLGMAPENYFCQDNGTTKFDSLQEWQDFANPLNPDGSVDKCTLYDLDYNQDFQGVQNASEITTETRPCESWAFYDNETSTLITDFQLVCSRSWYLTTSQVVYMFGVGAGVMISGIVSDKFGRSRPIFVFMVLLCIASISAAFSPNMISFIVFRCLIAAAASAVWTIGYVYSKFPRLLKILQ